MKKRLTRLACRILGHRWSFLEARIMRWPFSDGASGVLRERCTRCGEIQTARLSQDEE